MTFQKRLKSRREELGFTIRCVANTIGIPKSTYEAWEVDRFPKDPDCYMKLSEVLQLSRDYLMYGAAPSKRIRDEFSYIRSFVRAIIKDELSLVPLKRTLRE